MSRIYNFSAGPATMPLEAMLQARDELLEFQGTGASVMEISHRGKAYSAIHMEAHQNLRKLLSLPDEYELAFVAGGASFQFAMLPMNFLGPRAVADYANCGHWSAAAIAQARIVGEVSIAADCEKDIPARMPANDALRWTPGAAYAHITSNETISGAQWKEMPTTEAPLVADMSSDILSRPIDISNFAMIYAGAQKNLGPSGFAVVVIRRDFAAKGSKALPAMLRYSTYIEKESRYNTPPSFGIYMLALTTRWLLKEGLENVHRRNVAKAKMLYDEIDSGGFYRGTADIPYRSDMNVTFRLPTEELEDLFCQEAASAGLGSLKGHRSVGGIRASIYNAMPVEGVEALVGFMRDFEKRWG